VSAVHEVPRLFGRPAPGGAAAASQGAGLPKALVKRVLIGVTLAVLAIGVAFVGGYIFAIFVAFAALAAAREWHRLVGSAHYGREMAATSAAILGCIVAGTLSPALSWPLAIVAAGALLAAAMGATRGTPVVWSALGAFYIGIPSWSLVALRAHVGEAQWIVLGIFLIVWTADTAAMTVGQIFGGPKLIPSLSPNKTWAGLIGGLVLPGLVLAGYIAALGGNMFSAFAIGVALAAAGHAGDLFESWVKRRMGRKDSGESLPGHGGVLDRIDSMLVVAPLAALLIFQFGAQHLFGVHA